MVGQWWTHYWHWAGSNIGALPAELVLTSAFSAAFALLFRKPIARAVSWFRRERDEAAREAREDARKARIMMADLYFRTTGEHHEHSPGRAGGE